MTWDRAPNQVVQGETEGLEKGVGLWEGSRLVGTTREGGTGNGKS